MQVSNNFKASQPLATPKKGAKAATKKKRQNLNQSVNRIKNGHEIQMKK